MVSRSQVSFEFIVVLFVVIFVTVFFGVIAGDRLLELKGQQTNAQLQGVAVTVKNEIDIAHAVEPGYVRTFSLPDYLGNDNYTLGLQDGFVTVAVREQEFGLAVQPVIGSLKKGPNVISNSNGSVVLNG